MPGDQTSELNYKKGFNEGYIITKHLPELSDQLSQIKNETPRIDGFKDGRNEYFQEKAKERMNSFLKTDISKENDRTIEPKEKNSKDDLDKA
ncbi:MAG: hypothetical protein JSR97_01195 [Verrucomicrobia bacterium]|nr:hypothetical protein [Verrucomicrobiota bacterium]